MIDLYFLCQPPQQSLEGYKHVIDVEYCPPVLSKGTHFAPEVGKAKEAVQTKPMNKGETKMIRERNELEDDCCKHGRGRKAY